MVHLQTAIGMMQRLLYVGFFLFLAAALGGTAHAGMVGDEEGHGGPPDIEQGDRVVFIGNTFAVRMQLFSYFETLLATRFPEYQLRVRNLSRGADEVDTRPRPLNFGGLHRHLAEQKADVVVAAFGMNESFAGEEGLSTFATELGAFLDTLRANTYNGSSPPEVILVSPIAHEDVAGIPADAARHNRSLRRYTEAMREQARERSIPFVDLFTPTRRLMARSTATPLTFNGIHLTKYGYWVVSRYLGAALGLSPLPGRLQIDAATGEVRASGVDGRPQPLGAWVDRLDAGPDGVAFQTSGAAFSIPPAPSDIRHALPDGLHPVLVVKNLAPGRYELRIDGRRVAAGNREAWARGVPVNPRAKVMDRLRKAVKHKNQLWFYRYRPVNGEYIYGRRREPFGVQHFPEEMDTLERMVRDREQRIWEIARSLSTQQWRLERVAEGEVP